MNLVNLGREEVLQQGDRLSERWVWKWERLCLFAEEILSGIRHLWESVLSTGNTAVGKICRGSALVPLMVQQGRQM